MNFDFVGKYKSKIVPWGPVGYITYKRTYARMTDAGVTEEWYQTVERCVRSLIGQLDGSFTQEEIEELYDHVFHLRANFSGRFLWQAGTKTVDKVGADSIQNCWNICVNEPILPFTFCMDQLMLGGGVGFNIQAENVYSLPKVVHSPNVDRVDDNDVDFIVPDNREGWVKLLEKVLKSFYFTGKDLYYSTNCIRDRGAKIGAFGGIASGPEELVKGINNIVKILHSRFGEKLRPIDCLDIMNNIGAIVVAGNVRRSAEIAIGDYNDNRYLNSKAWGRTTVPYWRSMSNNSVNCYDLRELPNLFWQNYSETDENGNSVSEPFGLVNLFNCRAYGRIADGLDYRPDPLVTGMNPCGEITLESYEPCNLSEIYLPNIKDEDQFKRVAVLLYKVNKTISNYKFSYPETQEVVSRNRRIGIGVTGFLQAPHLRDPDIFHRVYRYIEETDRVYSQKLGVPESIKLTTTKPSGTLSLLAGVTPGVHPAYAPYYIRRIRFGSNDPLVEKLLDSGYDVEPQINIDGSRDYNVMVANFPIKTPETALCSKDVSAIAQMDWQMWLQRHWADNAVSCTIYYNDEELDNIKKHLERNYPTSIKSISFLRHSKHGFIQAPMEEITEEKYKELTNNLQANKVETIVDREERDIDNIECAGGSCPIK